MGKKLHLRAGALSNAIFVCVIMSIFCGCLVLVSHYQNLLNQKLEFGEQLINTNNATFNYYASNMGLLQDKSTVTSDILDEGIATYVKKKQWGFYKVLVAQTVFKTDTVSRIGLIGEEQIQHNRTTLYVTDYDTPLRVSGNTSIIGTIKVPGGTVGQAFLNGTTGNTTSIRGQKLKSGDRMPKIDGILDIDTNYETIPLGKLKTGLLIHTFDKETKVIDATGANRLSDITIKGNVIVLSKTNLSIAPTAQLEDVLLMAPKITIETGFKGAVQMVSEKEVEVKENVALYYPSSLYLKNDLDSVKVKIGSNSKLAGGIVIDGNTYSGSLQRELIIDPTAEVVGSVYCYGRTQLQGRITGSLYTDRFFLKTRSSEHDNVILNGHISRDKLPENFIELPLFKNENSKRYGVIKAF